MYLPRAMRGFGDGSRKHNSSRNPTASDNPIASRNLYYSSSERNSNIGDGLPRYSLKILGPLAPILLSDDYSDPEKLQNRLRVYSVVMLVTSTFFWEWALYNSFHLHRKSGGFDLGIVSFFGSGVSSSFLLRSASGGKCCDRKQRLGCCGKMIGSDGIRDNATLHSPPGIFLLSFAVCTQLTVAANYMLGILFAFTAGERIYVYFATYCVIFFLMWLFAAYCGWVLVIAYREAVVRAYGKDILNGPSGVGLLRSALIALANRSTSEAINITSHEEEDDIDDELRSLYEGRGGYIYA